MTRVLLNPELYPDEVEMVKQRQIEMRRLLFSDEDFDRIGSVLDIGCGHGTDVIQIAGSQSHIQVHGFTISQVQAELGNQRIAEKKLGDRAAIFHRDSAKDPFPGRYDLVMGIEVVFHIRDKEGLFRNITSCLNKNGRVLLVDYMANLRGPIVDPNIEISIATRQEWQEIFLKYQMVIDEVIDVSREIANYLHDPEAERHIQGIPDLARDTLRNYANQSMALEKGWITYALFKLRQDKTLKAQELREHNFYKLSNPTPYAEALQSSEPKSAYPFSRGGLHESAGKPDTVSGLAGGEPRPEYRSARGGLKEALITIFKKVLGLEQEEVLGAATFEELGIGSVNAVELLEAINTRFDLALPTSIVFECNTLDALARYLWSCLDRLPLGTHQWGASETRAKGKPASVETGGASMGRGHYGSPYDIAVIGISCRCAGARGKEAFWDIVSQGKVCIEEITDKGWIDYMQQHSDTSVPLRYGALLAPDRFDAPFFRISPKEAASMDVAQRLLLEESYTALEDAGYAPRSLGEKRVGTFIGIMGFAPGEGDFSPFYPAGFGYQHCRLPYRLFSESQRACPGRQHGLLLLSCGRGPCLQVPEERRH